jgi:chromosome segregation ATPase
LRAEIERLNGQEENWKKQEDDLRAALKVKDVMLNDQLRQINELRHEREEIEGRFNDEMAEFQAQVEELEGALDDSAQRAMDGETKCEALETEKHQLERQIAVLSEQAEEQLSALEQKRAALDFIEQEMDRMRSALSNQDELFQKRLQKRVEQHHEELEQIQAEAEEARERLRVESETARREVMNKYQSLSIELQSVAAQNSKLRVAIEQERKKNAQNDHDMRVLLAQVN